MKTKANKNKVWWTTLLKGTVDLITSYPHYVLASFIHTNKNKNSAGVTRFIDLFQIVYLLNCVLVANIYFTVEAGKTNVSQYKNRLKFAVKICAFKFKYWKSHYYLW